MEYTKGEWKIKPIGGGITPFIYEIRGNSEEFIGRAKTLANAHLIAAAPDMYEALQTLSEQLTGANISFSQDMFDAKRNARKALAKAEGR